MYSISKLAKLGAALMLAGCATAIASTPYPDKPISLVVPVAPGGGTDFTARLLADEMSKKLGQTVVVENQPGGAGNVGVAHAARAKPDGYTLVMPITSFPINATLYKKLPFDTQKDLTPIALAATLPLILVVNPELPAKTLEELIALAKEKPGTINFANSGVGTTAHLSGELFKETTKTDIVSVAYKGGGPAVTDLLGGHVEMYFSTPSAVLPHIQAGKLRALAVTSKERLDELPDVPTFVESGYPDLLVTAWFGIFAPAGTPDAIMEKLNTVVNEVLQQDNVRKKLATHSFNAEGNMSPKELKDFLDMEINRWGTVIKGLDLSVD
ncbi:tripartite tricarboxylate transporter substrate binding protein [Alcaligenaceae bacterium]|nr:tripartite tricarboxylate transporter substrate binding protein [Alcaligenaceae bacterium]